ncbi:MAG: zf-HC2 domain-containing protein [Bacillota bacterium]
MSEVLAAGTCPSEESMYAFLDGEMDAQSQLAMLRHLSECEACRLALAEIVSVLDEVAVTLREPLSDGMPSEESWNSAQDRIVDELRESGLVERRRRIGVRDIAQVVAGGAAKGARVAAAALWASARVAYSGASAAVIFASDVRKSRTRLAQGSRWRLAW